MLNPIRIYENDLTLVGEIDDYSSAYLTRSWHGVGSFSIQINANMTHSGDLAKGRIVMFAKDKYRCGLITTLEKSLGANGKGDEVITASGYELPFIFSWRTILPQSGQAEYTLDNSAETVMKTLVKDQCGSTADLDRRFTGLEIDTDLDLGTTYLLKNRYSGSVQTELQKISVATGSGYFIYIDESTKKLRFQTALGVDRTAGQSVNPRAIFSSDYDTIKSAKWSTSDNNFRNYAFVAGQGIGDLRVIREVFTGAIEPTGFERKEMFVDARDLSATGDIDKRGSQKLSEMNIETSVNGTPLTQSPLVYRTDYDLGDIVTIDVYDTAYNARITEVKESWSPLNYSIDLSFDRESPTIQTQVSSALESVRSSLSSTEGAMDQEVRTTSSPTFAGLTVTGFTKSGADAPALKSKKLTGTTNATAGGLAVVLHGLDWTKIRQWFTQVYNGTWWVESGSYDANNSFIAYKAASGFLVFTNPGATLLLSKAIEILVWYEE